MSKVTDADNSAQNGVVHVVDKVLILGGNVIDNIAQLSSLNGALMATNLTSVLTGDGPFTVFAPNNDAVGDFSGTIDASVLTYHVVAEKILSTDLTVDERTEKLTVNGASIYITLDSD